MVKEDKAQKVDKETKNKVVKDAIDVAKLKKDNNLELEMAEKAWKDAAADTRVNDLANENSGEEVNKKDEKALEIETEGKALVKTENDSYSCEKWEKHLSRSENFKSWVGEFMETVKSSRGIKLLLSSKKVTSTESAEVWASA